jgi:hypothetical protein
MLKANTKEEGQDEVSRDYGKRTEVVFANFRAPSELLIATDIDVDHLAAGPRPKTKSAFENRPI